MLRLDKGPAQLAAACFICLETLPVPSPYRACSNHPFRVVLISTLLLFIVDGSKKSGPKSIQFLESKQ